MATEETIDHSGKILERKIERSPHGMPGQLVGNYVGKVREDALRYGFAGYCVKYWDYGDGWVEARETFVTRYGQPVLSPLNADGNLS